MARPIEQNDWRTAEEWAHIIEKEIKTERNKAEFISRSIQEVYRPLYEESITISALITNIESSPDGRYSQLPAQKWATIKSSSSHLLVEDQRLKEEIESFYDTIHKYNQILGSLEGEIKKVIKEVATKFYKRDVENVQFWLKNEAGGGSSPELWDCILINKKPIEVNTKGKPDSIGLLLKSGEVEHHREPEYFNNFDDFFEIVKRDTKEKTRLEEMKNLFSDIKQKHESLKPEIEAQIKKLWQF